MTTPSVASPGIEGQEMWSLKAQRVHCALPFPEDTEKSEFGWVVSTLSMTPPRAAGSSVWSSEPLYPRKWLPILNLLSFICERWLMSGQS